MKVEWLSEKLSLVNYYKLWLNKRTTMFLPLPSFKEFWLQGPLHNTTGSYSIQSKSLSVLQGNDNSWPVQGVPVSLTSLLGCWRNSICQLQGPSLSLKGHWGQGQHFAKIKSTLIFLHVRICYIMTFLLSKENSERFIDINILLSKKQTVHTQG